MDGSTDSFNLVVLDFTINEIIIFHSFFVRPNLVTSVQSSDDASFQHTLFTQCQRTMLLLRRLPQPTIALLSPHQKVTAAGLQLVSMCDMIIAHEGSEFQYSGVNIGGWCVTPQTPNAHPSRSIPSTYTMGLLLTGDWSPASAALQAGLISKIYSKPEDAWNVVETLAGRNREALVLGKWSFWRMNGGAGAEYEEKFGEITKVSTFAALFRSSCWGARTNLGTVCGSAGTEYADYAERQGGVEGVF